MPDFFETVKRGLERGIATVGAKSKEMLEISQLRSQIRSLEEEKQAKLEELGNIVCTMVARGALDQERLQEKCRGIAALETGIKDKEERIRAIHRETEEATGKMGPLRIGQCSCGTDLFAGAKFCGGCGKPATELSKTSPGAPGHSSSSCSKCGAPVAIGARFCGTCGSPIPGADATE